MSTVLQNVTPHSLVFIYNLSEVHPETDIFCPDDVCISFLQKFDNRLTNYTTSHSKREHTKYTCAAL